jgi:GNAT superfamily N-acetyltransferase
MHEGTAVKLTSAGSSAGATVTREAKLSDDVSITALLHQLGYEVTQALIHEKLRALISSPTDKILVAAINDEVIGSVSLHAIPLFHMTGFLGRITSMVVDERRRGIGAGSALIATAEEWFGAVGCVKLEVTSADHRHGAHRFYEMHGFLRDGQRLSKKITHQ